MKPESARRAARVVEIKAEMGYVPPHQMEICARCRHFTQRGRRGVQGRCTSRNIDIAAKGWCRQFDWPDGKAPVTPGVRRLRASGERNPHAKLTEPKVVAILRMRQEGWSIAQLAPIFGVGETAISNILRCETWRHVPRQPAADRDRA